MNIKDNIINYLYDKNDVICLYDDYFYVYNYKSLDSFSDKRIVVDLTTKKITITGEALIIVRITDNELMISGTIAKVEMKKINER